MNEQVATIIRKPEGYDIANAILNMWKQPKSTLQRIENGRKLAQKYQWPIIAQKYEQLIHSIT